MCWPGAIKESPRKIPPSSFPFKIAPPITAGGSLPGEMESVELEGAGTTYVLPLTTTLPDASDIESLPMDVCWPGYIVESSTNITPSGPDSINCPPTFGSGSIVDAAEGFAYVLLLMIK